ncbi:deoxyribose-phosphate aldolase [Propionimicrobium lymphophilum]|uniref:Deoxyribose-phosphate aldolase n=1 Tax=Propionimicrobium lymphophilum ACS-093-V-SCH5 TaxID=883161 RepID=S2WXN2_9ACTN|nr:MULTISPECIES: deoxyribose-phosphate aldolase [Propionimicrobium]EPD32534.1 deoxyribose-phosphate aldolase [Propionimicrobium lymphophilum ACS-093-V-SCH5]ETJ96817.1 deoxyribose-phosphate aldolase [Propionimicrobium sp. BV2F7]MDK7710513.1 deoxyribose-phosphate aldolase [Propionimicrobium lymphophilum]MDK7734465.1 deoxyribose-phosphate aldolase [Propionimicrobium lymphophilum]
MSGVPANLIDHTLLAPEATAEDVKKIIDEAVELGTYSVCVSPSMLPITVPETLKVAAVCGFPSGAHISEVKALEAKKAAENGANEIDMVINVGKAKEHDWEYVTSDIKAVRDALPNDVVLKVIIESAVLTDEEIVEVCKCAKKANADFVKTSTGFHKAGGASVEAVKLMRETVGKEMGVKASGGIRDAETAEKMINAGANRLGLSSSRAVLGK